MPSGPHDTTCVAHVQQHLEALVLLLPALAPALGHDTGPERNSMSSNMLRNQHRDSKPQA